jgi:cytochrome c oxidase cbb3-type subunit 3/ubiquinol-cytochrome c reductase cytochrome c subunit
MKWRVLTVAVCLSITSACRESPVDSPVIPPNKIADFKFLYARNCAGCHGPDGKGGAAIGLADPVYLAIADDAIIRHVTADGVAGTSMPAFAQHSGGMLTDGQIDVITRGIRAWARADALRDANPPPYAAQSPGDPARGAAVYETYCSSCHGGGGRGGPVPS